MSADPSGLQALLPMPGLGGLPIPVPTPTPQPGPHRSRLLRLCYDESGQLLGEYDANGAPVYETIYLNTTPVGAIKQTGTAANSDITTTLYNVHADHIDTPRIITRQSDQAIVWRWDAAEAFGATAASQNPSGLGNFVYNPRFPGLNRPGFELTPRSWTNFQGFHEEVQNRVQARDCQKFFGR